MIEVLPSSTPACLVVKFGGKLHGDEYQSLIGQVESTIKKQAAVSMVLILEDLEFPEWGAVKADAHFGLKDYRQLKRVAFVGDAEWAEWFIRLIGPFTPAEEKSFPPSQQDEAIAWAAG